MLFNRKKKKIVNISNINDEYQAKKLEDTLKNLVDITRAKVNLKKKQVIVNYENTLDEILIQNTIEKLGFVVTGIKEAS